MQLTRTFLFAIFGLLSLQAPAQPTARETDWFALRGDGGFSAAAQSACGKGTAGPSTTEIWSPSHKRRISIGPTLDGGTAVIAIDEHEKQFPIAVAGWPCPEIGWSPASNLFFVTYSDGGSVGTFHVSTYRFARGKLAEISLTSAAKIDYQRRYPKCFDPEEPNMVGVAWSRNAGRFLVAAQVLPHSNCDDMGTFNVYEVAVSDGRIIRRLPQLAAKADLHNVLGPELLAADDSCFLQPGSCEIPALHGMTSQ